MILKQSRTEKLKVTVQETFYFPELFGTSCQAGVPLFQNTVMYISYKQAPLLYNCDKTIEVKKLPQKHH